MEYNWISLMGDFEKDAEKITFRGGTVNDLSGSGKSYPKTGNYICDKTFGGGSIEATIKFPEIVSDNINSCELILSYDTDSEGVSFLVAGIVISNVNNYAFSVQHFNAKNVNIRGGLPWQFLCSSGDKTTIKPNKEYKIKVTLHGSRLELFINQVSVAKKELPFVVPSKQVGIWCQSSKDIIIKDFSVLEEKAKAFVIMQFTTPYNELFDDVIQPKCKDKNIEAIRADQTYGPGHILSNVMQQISTAKFIIAEITPSNQNVFFEVGYAHAMNKPIIFIAEEKKELPFDVSGFRVLFYENSIRGKKKIEEGLVKHIEAILGGE